MASRQHHTLYYPAPVILILSCVRRRTVSDDTQEASNTLDSASQCEPIITTA